MNKKQMRIYEQWLKSNKTSLNDCYKNPSRCKLDAYFAIKHACIKAHGKRFRILSYNSYSFTCAYVVEKEGKTLLFWHDPYSVYCFEIPSV